MIMTSGIASESHAQSSSQSSSQGGAGSAPKSAAHDAARDGSFRIGKVTMAITDMEQMVKFYRETFGVELKGFEGFGGHMFYSGTFLGMQMLLCPNAIAGVEAKQNRHQFDIITGDFDGVLARAATSGGSVHDQGESGGVRYATLIDPDGNTMVIIEEK